MSLLTSSDAFYARPIVASPQHSATHRYGMRTMFARLSGMPVSSARKASTVSRSATVRSGGALSMRLSRRHRIARQSATASIQAFFLWARCLGWRLAQPPHRRPCAPCDVRMYLECFIAGFFGKRPRSFVLCFRYSTMVITAIFERGTHARRSYQARRGI